MKNKGQMFGVGAIIMLVVTLIVGLTLLSGSGGIAGQSAALSNTVNIVNETFTLAALNGYTDRPNCVNLEGSATVLNASDDAVQATGWTATTRVSPTLGYKVLTFKTTAGGLAADSVKASYTCLSQGYAEDSASRTIIDLVVLFACLALAVFAIGVAVKNFREVK